MNKIFAPVSILVLLAALAGGVVLTQRSANLKKSADEYFVVASIAPTSRKLAVGETMPILVKLNTGDAAKTLTGASIEINYDKTAFEFVSSRGIFNADGDMLYPLSGGYPMGGGAFSYDIGSGVVKIIAIPPGQELSGVVDVARVTLRSKVEDGRMSKVTVGGRAVTTTVVGETRTPGGEVGISTSIEGSYTMGDAPAVSPEPSAEPSQEPSQTLKQCDRCSVYYDYQRTKWQAADCSVDPNPEMNVERTYDASCTPPAATRRVNQCYRCSTKNDKEFVWWERTADNCQVNPTPEINVMRAVKDDCTLTTSPALKQCSRCSIWYDKQWVKWQAADCSKDPTPEMNVERTYDASCTPPAATRRVNQCYRCSTKNDKEFVWWERTADNCQVNPTSEINVMRAVKDDCALTTSPALKQCSRCSIWYDKQWVKWQATDCSVDPNPEIDVERTYDASCTPPAATRRVNQCYRCSTKNDKEFVWWERTADNCQVNPTSEINVMRAVKDDCTLTPTAGTTLVPSPASGQCPVCWNDKPAVTVVRDSSGKLLLGIRWKDVNNNEEGYGVRYCIGSGCVPTTGVTNTGPNVTSFLDLGPNRAGYTAGSLVRIRVRAMKTGCASLSCPITDVVIDGSKAISVDSWNRGGGAVPGSINPTAVPTIIVNPTVTTAPTGESCNMRCGDGKNCQEGLVCFPAGLGNCGPISPTVQSKLGQSPLTQADRDVLTKACPDATEAAIGAASNPETMIGFCRKPSCLNSTSCSCNVGTTPAIPTAKGTIYFTGTRYVNGEVGKIWKNSILAKGPGGSMESVEFEIRFNPKLVKVNKFTLIQKGLSKIVTNKVDNVAGIIRVAMSSSMGNTNDVVGIADVEWEAVTQGISWIRLTPIKMEVVEAGAKKTAPVAGVANIYVLTRSGPSIIPPRE